MDLIHQLLRFCKSKEIKFRNSMLTDSQKENQISKDGKIAEHYEEIMEWWIRWIIKIS